MIITYYGDTYFKLQAGNLTVLIDPTNQRSFKGADLILNTLKPALTQMPAEADHTVWVDHQGEFEIKGMQVRGWSPGYGDAKKAPTSKKSRGTERGVDWWGRLGL